jgi:hypothetical protein
MYFILKAMNTEEMRAYILKELTRSVPPEKIIYDLTEKSGQHWGDVEALVKQVQQESRGTVARKQSPLYLVLGVLTALIGLGLVIGGVSALYGIAAGTKASTLGVEMLAPLGAMNTIMYLINFGGPFLTMIGLGLAMLVGTMWGMNRMWSDILSDTGKDNE